MDDCFPRRALFGVMALVLCAGGTFAQLPATPTPIAYGARAPEPPVGDGSAGTGADPAPVLDRPLLVAPPERPPLKAPPDRLPIADADTSTVACGGWFLTLEAGAIAPTINHLKTSQDGSSTFLGQMHSQDLEWTAVGQIDFGYRFGCGDGIGFSFRAFGSSGEKNGGGDPTALDPPFFVGLGDSFGLPSGTTITNSAALRELHTRFDLQRYDIDYLSAERALGSSFHASWLGGVRIVGLHLDTSVTDSFGLTAQPSAQDAANGAVPLTVPVALHQSAKMDAAAAGVHLAFQGAWAPATNGVELFGKADAGFLVGGSRQRFGVSAMTGLGNFPEVEGSTDGTILVTTANVEAGIHYTIPLERAWLRLSVGYLFEAYWFSAAGSGASKHALFKELDLIDHGPFARCEIRY
jgi:hypothetical protein